MSTDHKVASSQEDDLEFIENSSIFSCFICLSEIQPGDGIILKNCSHNFCKLCISKVIKLSPHAQVRCPQVSLDNQQCTAYIQDRELRCFISEADYMKHLEKSLAQAEVSSHQSFHCKTPNCIGWVEIVNRNVRSFQCTVCRKANCVACKAVHEGMRCVDYKARNLTDNQKTNIFIKKLIREKKVMKCPKCGILVEKTKGCNHMKCTKCGNDFQWIGKSGFEWVR